MDRSRAIATGLQQSAGYVDGIHGLRRYPGPAVGPSDLVDTAFSMGLRRHIDLLPASSTLSSVPTSAARDTRWRTLESASCGWDGISRDVLGVLRPGPVSG